MLRRQHEMLRSQGGATLIQALVGLGKGSLLSALALIHTATGRTFGAWRHKIRTQIPQQQATHLEPGGTALHTLPSHTTRTWSWMASMMLAASSGAPWTVNSRACASSHLASAGTSRRGQMSHTAPAPPYLRTARPPELHPNSAHGALQARLAVGSCHTQAQKLLRLVSSPADTCACLQTMHTARPACVLQPLVQEASAGSCGRTWGRRPGRWARRRSARAPAARPRRAAHAAAC